MEARFRLRMPATETGFAGKGRKRLKDGRYNNRMKLTKPALVTGTAGFAAYPGVRPTERRRETVPGGE